MTIPLLRHHDSVRANVANGAPHVGDSDALSRHDGVLVVVLTITLVIAMWSFFDVFVAGVIATGIIFSIALRRWRDAHLAALPAPAIRVRNPDLNVSTIQIGGDIGGLMFVAGCLAIFYVGMPALRPFVLGSAAAASLMAGAVIAWRKTHALWSRSATSILCAASKRGG